MPAPAPAPPRAPLPPARQPTVARPPYSREPSERPGWLIPAAIAAVVVILLGIGGVVLVSSRTNKGEGPIAQTSPSARATASPKASPAQSPTPAGNRPQSVPTNFGPASADPISKVQFCTTANSCPIQQGTPNETGTACDLSSCKVEVAVYFSSPQKSVSVAYNLKFFDRCTGTITDLPGPKSTTGSAGWIVIIPADKWNVNIPSGVKSGALIAVSSQPSVAASAPLLLGSDTTC